jgi:nucleoside-diphosphate-sugar epimerase
MKILITGVYGIVGSYLCEKLKQNHEVIGIGRRKEYDKCDKYYSCDITDKAQIENVLKENKDLDIIVHCAALAHNKGDDLSKDKFMKVNYEASKYLSDLSSKLLNLKNFVFISTISVYGEKIDKEVYIETDECNPKSPYAVAKRMSEEYIIKNYKKNYSILRLAPVYSDSFRLNIDRRTLIKGIPYRVGNGKNKVSLCNIDNIYKAVEHIANNSEKEKNEIYNISDQKVYDFNDLLAMENRKAKIIFPKFAFSMLYKINKVTMKKQFIHENSIKLVTSNIYSSEKISNKLNKK